MSAFADRKLWDDLGNYCRIQMHQIGHDTFELYMHDFNDAIPTRRIGRFDELNNIAEIWLDYKHNAGYKDQLPSYNPKAA